MPIFGNKPSANTMHATLHMSAISRTHRRNAVGAAAYRSAKSVTYRSAVACAAYRSGEKVNDERYAKTYDYTKKHNVLHSEIITPEGAPDWMSDREKLWNGVEMGEKRKDAQLAKEALLILPRNLDLEQQKDVVREFIKENFTSRGLVADYAIHSPDAADGDKNPHAHVMFTLRPVEGQEFGKKLTGLKNGGLDGFEFLRDCRQSYERLLNEASEKADSEIRFDLGKHQEQQRRKTLDQRYHQPETHMPSMIWHIEKGGKSSTIGAARRNNTQQILSKDAQQEHQLYSAYYQLSYFATRAVDHVRDDVAHKYYEVMYGAEHAYGQDQERNQSWYER